MSRDSRLGAIEYAVESGWAEVSSTFGARMPIINVVDPSGLEQAKIDNPATVQYLGDGAEPILSVYGGEFTSDLHLCGHGSTTAGAISTEEHEDLLGYAIGRATSTGTGTTATGGTATVPTTTASGTLAPGGIVWFGSVGDAKGDGQPGVISTHSGNNLTLLTALPAAPANTDVIASSVMIYPDESVATSAVSSIRARLLSGNQHYAAHGCHQMSTTISGFNPAETPKASIRWGVSRWSPVSATFPSAVSVDTFLPAPTTMGSLFVQTRGTAARQTYTCRDFQLNITTPVHPNMGPGGVVANQVITGAVRLKHEVTVSFTVDAQTASATPTWLTRYQADPASRYHILFNANNAATGKRVAVYLPNACMTTVPIQTSVDGINRERITMRGYTGTDTTSALTLSSFRIALG